MNRARLDTTRKEAISWEEKVCAILYNMICKCKLSLNTSLDVLM